MAGKIEKWRQGNLQPNMYRSLSRTSNQNMHQSFVRNRREKDQGKLKWSRKEQAWICSRCQTKKTTKISCIEHDQKNCSFQNPSWHHAWEEATMGCLYCGQTGFESMEMFRDHIKKKDCPKLPDWNSKGKVQGEAPQPRPVKEMPEDMGKMKWSEEERTWICSICQTKRKNKGRDHHNRILCSPQISWREAWDNKTRGCRHCGQSGFESKKELRDHIQGKVCPMVPGSQQGDDTPVRKTPVRNAPDNSLCPESTLPEEEEDEDSDEEMDALEDKGDEKATRKRRRRKGSGRKGVQTDLGRANWFWKYSKQTDEKIYEDFLRKCNKADRFDLATEEGDLDKLVWSEQEKCWTCSLCQVKKTSQMACKKHSRQDCLNKPSQNPSWQLGWCRNTMSCRYCGMTGFKRRKSIRKHIQDRACPKLPNWSKVLGRPTKPEKPPGKRVQKQATMRKHNARLLELQARGLTGPGPATLPGAQQNFKVAITAGNPGMLGPMPGTETARKPGMLGPMLGTGGFPNPWLLMGGLLGPVPGQSAERSWAGPQFPTLARNLPQFREPSSVQDQLGSRFEAPMAQIRPKARVPELVTRNLKALASGPQFPRKAFGSGPQFPRNAPASGPQFPKLARNRRQFPGPSSVQDQLNSHFKAPMAQMLPARQTDSRPLLKPGGMRTDVGAPGREPGFEKFPQTSGYPRLSAAESGAEDWSWNSAPRAWPSTLQQQQQQSSTGRPERWGAGAVGGGPQGTWSDSSSPHTSHTATLQTWPGHDREPSGNDRDPSGNQRNYPGNERDPSGNQRDCPERFNERPAEHHGGRSGPERFNERSAEHHGGRSGPERFNERSAEHHGGRSGPERFNERSAERHGGRSGPERFSDHERSGRLTSERIFDAEMSVRFSVDKLGNHERSIYGRYENDRETRRQQDPYRGGGERGNDRDAQHCDPNREDDAHFRDPKQEGGWRGNDDDTRSRDSYREDRQRNDSDTRSRDSYWEDRQRNDSEIRGRGQCGEDHRRDRSPIGGGSRSDHRYPEERAWDSHTVPKKEQRY